MMPCNHSEGDMLSCEVW